MIQTAEFWLWLAASVLVYWMLPLRARAWFVAISSFAYLATIEVWSIAALTAWTLAFFYIPRWVGGDDLRRVVILLSLAAVGYLAAFKYVPALLVAAGLEPASVELALPLGISYFTFKFIHYAIEFYRGHLKSNTFGDFAAYIFLVPMFTAGPIERFDHFLANREARWQLASFVEGMTRIVHGLVKKFVLVTLVLAPLLGKYTDVTRVVDRLDYLPAWKVWCWFVLSFLILYLDFSAYTDLAIGGARLFGLRIMENFHWPILARNISEFWRRWHMTLSGWCRAYVYMPLIGATRNPYIASWGAFLVMGIWHGASWGWFGWGMYHAGGVIAFIRWSEWKRRHGWVVLDNACGRALATLATLLFVSAAGVITSVANAGLGAATVVRVYAKLLLLDGLLGLS